MRVIKSILITALFSVLNFYLFSQNSKLLLKRCPVKTLNYEQGLTNNTCIDVITDALGFTWVSTKTGMQRYNGYALETINPIVNEQAVIIHTPVHFFNLQNGSVLISYMHGVLQYNPYTNSFKKIITIKNEANNSFPVIPVKESGNDIYCLQHNKGLVVYDANKDVIKKIVMANDGFIQNVFNRQEIFINANFHVNFNSIFIYNGIDRIEQFNIQTKRLTYIHAENIFSFATSNNRLYIISDNGISGININSKKVEKFTPLKTFITENLTAASCFYNQNNQLLISLNSHLFELDSACNYRHEFTNLNRNAVVSVGYIRSIYADEFRRIWLLTNDDIKRIQNFDVPFEHLIYANDKNNFVRSIYYDKEKHIILAGCYNGGIQLYDTSGNALWQTAVISGTIKDINAIEKLSDDNYLVETIGRGVYVLNLPSKKLQPLQQSDSKEKIDAVNINFSNNIQRINDSTMLITTSSNIYGCAFKKNIIVNVKPLLPVASDDQLNCSLYAHNKIVWTGTSSGKILRLHEDGNVDRIQVPENYLVRSITEDAHHNVWTGTDKGLYVYNTSGKLIKSFTIQSGLLNDCIYALLPIEDTTAVFASSNLGLSYISLKGDIVNYTKESGLQENEFNTQSAIKTSDGKYYFGGVNGITSFYPSSLSNVVDTPVLNITKLVIDDSLYNSSPGYWKGDSIKLKYAQNHIQFDLAATGLLNTNEYLYKYRLKNFENKWQTTHEPASIKYVLEPGNYLFEISCSPVFSSGSVFKRTITIIVSPPFWQTWWFKTLIILVAIAIIVLIVQQYLHSRYQKKLNVLKLTQEIQHERERISYDLHDNLGAYAAAIASNISTVQNANDNIHTEVFKQLKNNAQAIINQLNDTIWALNKESIYLTAVSDRFKVFLQKIRPNYPFINIEIKESIIKDELLSPANALHLFRMMQEAVNNALKHSGGNDVFIELVSDKKWIVIIKDNGKGMPEKEKTAFGNGLNNIRTRSKAAGWHVQWISEPQNGTEVVISSATTN